MAHLAAVTPPTAKPLISAFSRKTTHLGSPRFHNKVCTCNTVSDQERHVQRRNVALGLAGVVLGLSVGGGNAKGAARRPPPPPPEEKKDPNVTGVTAKVLASKKRKEAMKESIAKLREKGKAIQEPSK
ncbi:uncharacterized protein LOC105158809 [Sesamum indicum]|uniref:Uncharacterized protein LOC105158809 n=1 Tax=Sesamum indicum TaxID=4182 RepID=A0A6I9SWU8_SESIN|nr:uncharacterized protein LOC105158809 [Sesamum indicum]